MTDKELMEWYQEWWKKQNPKATKCDLVFVKTKKNKAGEWVLKVGNPAWKNPSNTKYFKDAQHAWNSVHNPKSKELNLKVNLPFNKPKTKKEFKTVGCNIDLEFYNKVKKVCDSHNMTMHELIKTLLKQVINESK